MYEDKFKDFDLEFRSALADAEEEVPSRVWDAVSGRLGQKTKVVTLRWRRAVAGVAAAAAIVAAALVFRHQPGWNNGPESLIALSSAEDTGEPLPEDTHSEESLSEEFVPSIEEQLAGAFDRLAQNTGSEAYRKARSTEFKAPTEETAQTTSTVRAEENTQAKDAVTTDVESSGKADSASGRDENAGKVSGSSATEEKTWADPFAEEKDVKSGRGLDWKIGGNITSNEATLSKQTKRALPQAAPSSTGIYNEGKSTYFIPLSFGAGVRYHITDIISIGTGLEYTLLTRSFTGRYIKIGEKGYEKDITTQIQNDLHYAGIPLNLYIDIINSDRVSLYTYAGGLMEKGIANVYSLSDRGSAIRHNEHISGLQWSVSAGIGVGYALTDKIGLYLDPSAKYFFDCGQPMSVRTVQPLMFNFEVGLRLNL